MIYFDTEKTSSTFEFAKQLKLMISSERRNHQPLVLLCIGSDRATGDCLGPIIGYKLSQRQLRGISIYGTLDQPVHAKNLQEIINSIYATFRDPYIIAIDASLGKTSHIGYFTLAKGALKPGAGVGKELPQVGDLHITGIVNISGFLEHSMLQTTRLQVVMNLADRISQGILYCLAQMEQPAVRH